MHNKMVLRNFRNKLLFERNELKRAGLQLPVDKKMDNSSVRVQGIKFSGPVLIGGMGWGKLPAVKGWFCTARGEGSPETVVDAALGI